MHMQLPSKEHDTIFNTCEKLGFSQPVTSKVVSDIVRHIERQEKRERNASNETKVDPSKMSTDRYGT